MKRKFNFISLLLAVVMLFSMIPFSSAANIDNSTVEVIDLGDGFTVEITTVTVNKPNARSTSSTIESLKKGQVSQGSQKIGVFTIWGEFSYNGVKASAIDHDWTAVVTSGYDYDGDSSMSGATVKGSCTFTGNGISKTLVLKMTCDKDGNIS